MKLLMLCREPRLYSCQRLKEAAKRQGHEMDVLDPKLPLHKTHKIHRTFRFFLSRKIPSRTLIYCLIMMLFCLDLAQQDTNGMLSLTAF